MLRSGLVVLEIALALVMLIGATLLARSFNRLRSVNPGFEASNLLTCACRSPAAETPRRRAAWPSCTPSCRGWRRFPACVAWALATGFR
jgi:hypothetical protein